MHPEIEKFYLRIYEAVGKLEQWGVWVGLKNDRYHTIGQYSQGNNTYYLNKKSYNEDEMLRIIKLKAFI